MEFEKMMRIWDTQDDVPLYTIDQDALHRSITARKNQTARFANTNDIGLMLIFLGTAIMYSYLSIVGQNSNVYDYLIVGAMLGCTAYVWLSRMSRKRDESKFDRTILGDLDHAIANVDYEVKRSRSMIWWCGLPSTSLVLLNLSQNPMPIWKWMSIIAAFVLSWLLLRWEYTRRQKPRKLKLESLRTRLIEDSTHRG